MVLHTIILCFYFKSASNVRAECALTSLFLLFAATSLVLQTKSFCLELFSLLVEFVEDVLVWFLMGLLVWAGCVCCSVRFIYTTVNIINRNGIERTTIQRLIISRWKWQWAIILILIFIPILLSIFLHILNFLLPITNFKMLK